MDIKNSNNTGIIYLIQPVELIGTNHYKIGCSSKNNLDRCKKGYKTGSRFIIIMECNEPFIVEHEIKKQFTSKFTLIYGREYFKGNEQDLKKEFYNIVCNKNIIKYDKKIKKKIHKNKCKTVEMTLSCNICLKKFKYYSMYEKHLARKIKCKSEGTIVKCQYCSSILASSKSLINHKNYYCKLIPNDIKEQILLKKNKKKYSDNIINNTNNTTNTNSNNTNSNNTNSNNDNCQFITINICGNEVPENLLKSISKLDMDSIELLRKYIPSLKRPFGYENLDNLMSNEKKIINFYNDIPQDTYRNLLNEIHSMDENRNFAIPNVSNS